MFPEVRLKVVIDEQADTEMVVMGVMGVTGVTRNGNF
jgi:hypothetical protein